MCQSAEKTLCNTPVNLDEEKKREQFRIVSEQLKRWQGKQSYMSVLLRGAVREETSYYDRN